jgi:hypothetical protein
MDGEEEQRRGLTGEVGKVCAFEGGIWWKSCGVGIQAISRAFL